MTRQNKLKWVAIRNYDLCGVFEDRKQAVKWLKGLLKQTLKDFDKQDKTDEFDYPIELFSLSIKPVDTRKEYLGL